MVRRVDPVMALHEPRAPDADEQFRPRTYVCQTRSRYYSIVSALLCELLAVGGLKLKYLRPHQVHLADLSVHCIKKVRVSLVIVG